ncbi:MAG: antitoxin VbhA family protein [Galactobacter sp.]
MGTTTARSKAWIDRQVTAIDAGQRMAGEAPTDADREAARRILAGEITADEAIEDGLKELEAAFQAGRLHE